MSIFELRSLVAGGALGALVVAALGMQASGIPQTDRYKAFIEVELDEKGWDHFVFDSATGTMWTYNDDQQKWESMGSPVAPTGDEPNQPAKRPME